MSAACHRATTGASSSSELDGLGPLGRGPEQLATYLRLVRPGGTATSDPPTSQLHSVPATEPHPVRFDHGMAAGVAVLYGPWASGLGRSWSWRPRSLPPIPIWQPPSRSR